MVLSTALLDTVLSFDVNEFRQGLDGLKHTVAALEVGDLWQLSVPHYFIFTSCYLFYRIFIEQSIPLSDPNMKPRKDNAWSHFPLVAFTGGFNFVLLSFMVRAMSSFWSQHVYWGVFPIPDSTSLTLARIFTEWLTLLLIGEFLYYWLHRLGHVSPFYSWVHGLHHKVVYPQDSMLDSAYVHPVEAVAGSVVLFCLPVLLSPMQVWIGTWYIYVITSQAANMIVHSNRAIYCPGWIDVEHHNDHHRLWLANYAQLVGAYDYLFGTAASQTKEKLYGRKGKSTAAETTDSPKRVTRSRAKKTQ
eukprot:TRINITY_DN9986_c0_g1_i1.p1 TRINITY_DN9986_c0_g1~~TRINITY_DN9986_c0_g1_i1.p1  ORF type:complete len:309 (+),score=64.35 TRINITY_DN9986_c0_g1_i1:24-929(+)